MVCCYIGGSHVALLDFKIYHYTIMGDSQRVIGTEAAMLPRGCSNLISVKEAIFQDYCQMDLSMHQKNIYPCFLKAAQ